MTDAEIIKALGGSRVVAEALGLSRQRVVNWTLKERRIAPEHRPAVYKLAERAGLAVDEVKFFGLPKSVLAA